MTRTAPALIALIASLALPSGSSAAVFGTDPIRISEAASGDAPNGSSGNPTTSGDNRKMRYVAFYSDATNLVEGDTNGARDIFLWSRPRGSAGLTLDPGAGSLARVSVTNSGSQANGNSFNPSLDGSITRTPHCVAFQSEATNLAPGDHDRAADIFVRDIRARRTFLVSRGITGAASDPSIDGGCREVAYVAGGRVFVQGVRSGRARLLGSGRNPDHSLDGRAVAWQSGARIRLRRDGLTSTVALGQNPTVSDAERLPGRRASVWGVSFETKASLLSRDRSPGFDMYMRVLRARGGAIRTDLISAPARGAESLGGNSFNGGITAYAPNRGILTFAHADAERTVLYYRNNNSGNIDDLAHAASVNGEPGITEVQTSARANFVAFTSSYSGDFARAFSCRRGCEPGQLFNESSSVYVKHLVDGEPL